MANRWRLLWPVLLLSCSANADVAADEGGRDIRSGEGGVRRRRWRRRPRQLHDHRPSSHRHGPVVVDRRAERHPTYRRLSTVDDCAYDQKLFALTFQTDSYGKETSWFLRSEDVPSHGGHGAYVGYGPPDGISYGDFTLYSFSYCLKVGSTYTLAMEDNFGDGMCCSRGTGGYEYSIGGVRAYSTKLMPTFRDYVEHTFTVEREYDSSPALPAGQQPASQPEEAVVCAPDPGSCGCEDLEQEDYRGTISTTKSGRACRAWADTDYPPASYPDGGLEENYCRSPDGGWPWCFATGPDGNGEWEYCRIPSCPMAAGEAEPQPSTPVAASSPATQAPTWSGPTMDRPTTSPAMSPSASPSSSPTKLPTPPPTPAPTPKPTPGRDFFNFENGCYGGDVLIRVEARADEYSTDTSWEILDPDGVRILHQPEGSFAELEYKTSSICVPHGEYTFVIRDKYGDGMCCRYGEGFFKVSFDGREVLNGGSYNEDVTVKLNVGYEPEGYMTERDHLYLAAHNDRRRDWHERYNLTYVPLVWSPAIAATSKAWAEELLHSCGVVGIEHEDFQPFGENLAKNTGNPNSWGQLYPPTNIVGRWVDFEIGLPYPSNGHLTQALWRASKYMGCGESVKEFRNGVCRVQVCRYGRAGNCDMKRFDSTNGENWLVPMLDNYTRCGPDCPPEGCF